MTFTLERSREHFQFLDGIRGIAILGVFVFHCLEPAFGFDQLAWGRWFPDFAVSKAFLALLPATFGGLGVAMFFAVSGFCIHLSFVRGSPSDWRGFYLRRFFRIYPPYLVALLFFAVVFPPTRLSFHWRFDWMQFGSHLLLVHNLDRRFYFGINPAFWSIAIEAQLYLIYPALLALVGRLGWRRTLIALGTLEVVMRGITGVIFTVTGREVPRWFSASPIAYWYSWAIGAAVADAFVQKRKMPFESSSPMLWLLLVICTACVKPLVEYSFLLCSVFTVTIIARVLGHKERPVFRSPVFTHLRFLGVCSYSFYLLHQPFIKVIPRVLSKMNLVFPPLGIFAVCIGSYPFILVLSWFYYRQCEVRSIAMGKLLVIRGFRAPE